MSILCIKICWYRTRIIGVIWKCNKSPFFETQCIYDYIFLRWWIDVTGEKILEIMRQLWSIGARSWDAVSWYAKHVVAQFNMYAVNNDIIFCYRRSEKGTTDSSVNRRVGRWPFGVHVICFVAYVMFMLGEVSFRESSHDLYIMRRVHRMCPCGRTAAWTDRLRAIQQMRQLRVSHSLIKLLASSLHNMITRQAQAARLKTQELKTRQGQKCSLEAAKRSFYRTANQYFW